MLKATKLLGQSSTRRHRQVSSSLGYMATITNVLLAGTLTYTVTAFLIPFLPLGHCTILHVYTRIKRPSWVRTENDEIMNANYDLDDQ